MTGTQSANASRLKKNLQEHGSGFDFVQAMRLLMRLYPERAALGGWDDPSREIARLTVLPTFAFPPSEIATLELPGEAAKTENRNRDARNGVETPARLAVRFLGLTGPQAVLPHIYTEQVAARSRQRDHAFRDFLDIFHHRALSLFYRAWERHHTTVPAERGAEDRMHWHLLDLAGAGTDEVRKRSDLSTNTLAYYAGLFAMQSRPAVGLGQLVADYFHIPAQIDQFVGEWQQLKAGGQFCVGDEDFDGQLGAAVLGNAVYDPMARVCLRLGPLTRSQFDSFLPQGHAHETLRQLAHFYADDQVGVDAQLVLARDEIPSAQLSAAGAPVLGFGTWLRAKPPVRDADDVYFKLC